MNQTQVKMKAQVYGKAHTKETNHTQSLVAKNKRKIAHLEAQIQFTIKQYKESQKFAKTSELKKSNKSVTNSKVS